MNTHHNLGARDTQRNARPTTHEQRCVCVCKHVHTQTRLHVYTYAYMHVFAHTCTYEQNTDRTHTTEKKMRKEKNSGRAATCRYGNKRLHGQCSCIWILSHPRTQSLHYGSVSSDLVGLAWCLLWGEIVDTKVCLIIEYVRKQGKAEVRLSGFTCIQGRALN